MKGPLKLIQELWKGNQGSGDSVSVISYVLQMREWLEAMTKLAEAQSYQK